MHILDVQTAVLPLALDELALRHRVGGVGGGGGLRGAFLHLVSLYLSSARPAASKHREVTGDP